MNRRLIDHALDENNEACQEIKSYLPLPEKKMSHKYTCERLAPPPISPLQNMLYGALGFRDMRDKLVNTYIRSQSQTNAQKTLNPSETYNNFDRGTQQIIAEVTMYSYNGGITKMRNYFDKFMRTNKKISHKDFTGPKGKWLQFLTQETIDQKDSRKEFINYIYPTSRTLPGYNSHTIGKTKAMSKHLLEFNISPDKCSNYSF